MSELLHFFNIFQVGSVLKNTFRSGQEALTHLVDIGNHAKNAVYNTRHSTPRIIKMQKANQQEQTILLSPRIAHIDDETQVESAKGKTTNI